jgi:ribonuclease T2
MIFVKSIVLRLFLIILATGCFQSVWAEKASGKFTAKQTCPAYVSKNKLTNPDNTYILPGYEYDIIEVLSSNATWYRIITPHTNPKQRWVSADCGEARLTGNKRGTDQANCDIDGQADSYVLALSWQPAFCETKPDKAECEINDPKVYQARHFTLHGLWPNKKNCGKHYGFCGEIKKRKTDFCDYPAITLTVDSEVSLAEVMPSVKAGSCLERHEWYKHGTCTNKWMDDYFDLAADLTRQFNDAGMAYFMNRKIGQQVRTEDFINRVSAVLGAAAKDRINLICHQGMLVEVRLNLSRSLAYGDDLEKLIPDAPLQEKSNCGETFLVDAIGQ